MFGCELHTDAEPNSLEDNPNSLVAQTSGLSSQAIGPASDEFHQPSQKKHFSGVFIIWIIELKNIHTKIDWGDYWGFFVIGILLFLLK